MSSSLLALAGGGNIGLVALGALGTIIPAVFLSEDTDRSLLRERIIYISLTQPLLAFGVYFFLRDDGNLTQILIFSFLSALIANLAAFSLTSYIESMFRLTSSFKLSELADRNHPALRYLEDNAIGTFNHSFKSGIFFNISLIIFLYFFSVSPSERLYVEKIFFIESESEDT